jgi:hypothetical protein
MSTPLDAIVHAVQNITWGEIWSALGATFLFVVGATWRIAAKSARLDDTQDYVEQMATNDLPHSFHVLLNMDKNIAKMSGGDTVDFKELDAKLKGKK